MTALMSIFILFGAAPTGPDYIIYVTHGYECVDIYRDGVSIGCGHLQETGCFDSHDEMCTGCDALIVEVD